MINRRKVTGYRQPWSLLADYRYGSRRYYREQETELKKLGLYPIGNYFSYWSEHIRLVLDTIPESNLLVLRTSNISKSTKNIADFLEINHGNINTNNKHKHGLEEKPINIENIVGKRYLKKQAKLHCEDTMKKFYGGI
jgi:hypothetical protein